MSAGGANQPSSRTEWWFVFAVSVLAFALGWYGIHAHDAEHEELTLASEAYQALQFFALHGAHIHDATEDLPWQLHAGRIGAAFVLFWAAFKIAGSVLATYVYLARQVWRPGHVVVCGLGELGLPMAREAKRRGWRVVAIERSETSEGARTARASGIPVIVGNACDIALLNRARIRRARRIWALTNDDDINVGIAALAGRIRRNRFSPELICRSFINEPRLRESLRGLHAGKTFRYRVETGPDLYVLRARHAFDHPARALDHVPVGEKGFATLVVVGFGQMGEALALQAARIGHFHIEGMLRLRVADEQGAERLSRFKERFKHLDLFASSEAMAGAMDVAAVRDQLIRECSEAHREGRPITFAFCHDHANELNMSLALDLSAVLPTGPASLLVYLDTSCGLSHLLPEDGDRADDIDPRIHAVGMIEKIWTLDSLENDRDDLLAQQFHLAYLAERALARKEAEAKGEPYQPRPTEVPWEQLSEFFRDSNRAIADHVPVKMRALGYELGTLSERGDAGRVKDMKMRQIEILAEMEHRRWCAFYWLGGWEYADKRDDAAKHHPDLRPWNALSQEERYIDKEMMRTIVAALEAVGEGVYERAGR